MIKPLPTTPAITSSSLQRLLQLFLKGREHRLCRHEWSKVPSLLPSTLVPGGRKGSSAHRRRGLQLSALWVKAGSLGTQKTKSEFSWQHVGLHRDLSQGKNRYATSRPQQVPAGPTGMQRPECEAFLRLPWGGAEGFCYGTNLGTALVLWRTAEPSQKPTILFNNSIRNHQLLMI